MANNHNLSNVVRFEFVRTIRKKSFWIAALGLPLLLLGIVGLVYASDKAASKQADNQKNAKFSLEYTDHSGLINQKYAVALKARSIANETTGISDVKQGRVDAYAIYPQDPSKQSIQVYGKNINFFANNQYGAVAIELLKSSLSSSIKDPKAVAILQTAPNITTTAYDKGHVAAGLNAIIPLLIPLAILYVVIVFLGNQMLTSTTEEKENRVTEMILTTLDPRTLIVGKIISTFMAGALQILTLLVPMIIVYIFFRAQLNIPNIDLSHLSFSLWPTLTSLGLLVGGFIIFTGALVSVGAIMPTAKEAGQYFSVAIIAMLAPLYTIGTIVADPSQMIVKVFSYFPLSTPVTMLMRNAFGSLTPIEAIIGLVELFVFGFALINLAVILFRGGSLAYGRRLDIRRALKKQA